MSSRNYCFTIQSTERDVSVLPEFVEKDNREFKWSIPLDKDGKPLSPELKFIIYQRERCPTTGRAHYQGYCEFSKNLTIKQAKALLGCPWAHLEKRRGTQQQCIDYCSKSETQVELPFKWGEPAQQGKKTAVNSSTKDIISSINEKTNLKEFAMANPMIYVRHCNGLDRLINMYQKPRYHEMNVIVHYGLSGTGKTRKVFDDASLSKTAVFTKPSAGEWWDGYNHEPIVLLDDYYGSICFTEFLRVLDRWPYQGQIKGGYVEFNSHTIYITSNVPPEEWYPDLRLDHKHALKRRITKILHFTGNNQFVEVYSRPLVKSEDVKGDIISENNVSKGPMEQSPDTKLPETKNVEGGIISKNSDIIISNEFSSISDILKIDVRPLVSEIVKAQNASIHDQISAMIARQLGEDIECESDHNSEEHNVSENSYECDCGCDGDVSKHNNLVLAKCQRLVDSRRNKFSNSVTISVEPPDVSDYKEELPPVVVDRSKKGIKRIV